MMVIPFFSVYIVEKAEMENGFWTGPVCASLGRHHRRGPKIPHRLQRQSPLHEGTSHKLALNIREQGRGGKEPGRLRVVQAIGWWLDEGKVAQVSTNLTDLDVTTPHQVFVEVEKDAKELSLAMIGSEIVGLVPPKPVLDAAEYFIAKEKLFILEEEQKVQLV